MDFDLEEKCKNESIDLTIINIPVQTYIFNKKCIGHLLAPTIFKI